MSSRSPQWTSCSASRASCSARRPSRDSGPSSRSASTSSTRWAAATSRCRCIRSPTTSTTRSACTTRRTRATTCSTPTMTPSSTSGSRRASIRRRCSPTCVPATDGGHPFDAEKYVNCLPRPQARPLRDSGGHGPLLRRQLDGAGDLGDAVHLHLQALGLGPRRPRRHPATDPHRPRRAEHPVGSRHRVGRSTIWSTRSRSCAASRVVRRRADRPARARVHRGPPALVRAAKRRTTRRARSTC